MYQYAQVHQATGLILNQETVYTTVRQIDSLLTELIDSVYQIVESILPLEINYPKSVFKDALKTIGQTIHPSFVYLNALIVQTCMEITLLRAVFIIVRKMVHIGLPLLIEIQEDV